jgi:hypothetical protein
MKASRHERRRRQDLMNHIDTDLDSLTLDPPPSPPPVPLEEMSTDDERNATKDNRNSQSQTPYYDYACMCPSERR